MRTARRLSGVSVFFIRKQGELDDLRRREPGLLGKGETDGV